MQMDFRFLGFRSGARTSCRSMRRRGHRAAGPPRGTAGPALAKKRPPRAPRGKTGRPVAHIQALPGQYAPARPGASDSRSVVDNPAIANGQRRVLFSSARLKTLELAGALGAAVTQHQQGADLHIAVAAPPAQAGYPRTALPHNVIAGSKVFSRPRPPMAVLCPQLMC